jgi:ferredoxin--NADP+ reductase
MSTVRTKNQIVSVLNTRHLTDSTYVLRIERAGMEFEAGQYISLGLPGTVEKREYSIYSGMQADYLEILVKEIEGGIVSKQLKHLQPGAKAELDGPFGFFTLGMDQREDHKLVFIASGTGIAPFHSYVRSYPSLDYMLIHGVRYGDEAYDSGVYRDDRYILCTSRDKHGHYHGRITGYLENHSPDKTADYYLCGNSNLIHDVYGILKEYGIDAGNIHAEVYF